VSFWVLAPEHPLVSQIVTDEQKEAVERYVKQALEVEEMDRADATKEKTGVWTGAYALHPITGKKIPIWIADYVLMGYGTGGVMGVPAHDERDFAFAKKYHLPILPVKDPGDIEERMEILTGKKCFVGDGLSIHSAFQDFSCNGLSTCAISDKIISFLETEEIGKRSVQYKLRDWLFSRQRYWGEPIPILHFPDGTMRSLELDELPLTPPILDDYKPASSGQSPLAKVASWVDIIDPKTGKKAVRETNTMPQWAGSCWYYLRFCDPQNTKAPWGEKEEKYWLPVDLYVGGVEHAVLHLLYARFWHKVFYDLQLVHSLEPFATLRNQGLVTARSFKMVGGGYLSEELVEEKDGKYYAKKTGEELISQIDKMSKSKLNGVSPDAMIEEFGADALRLYAMFMGPFEREKVWSTDAVMGCRRFLNRFYDMVVSDKVQEEESLPALKLTHKLLSSVLQKIESMEFNTAISHMMEYLNEMSSQAVFPKSCVKMAVQVLYPFAPHIGEELWEILGEKNSIAYAPIPEVNPAYLIEDSAIYVVQINGKLRGKFDLPIGKTEADLMELVKRSEELQKYLAGGIVKTVFVPNKLLNIVVRM
jgi:leucyl-tRNA synthetase